VSDVRSEAVTNKQELSESHDHSFMTYVALILAHCKPTKGLSMVKGVEVERDYYSECEWRYLPWVESGFTLLEEKYKNEIRRTEANNERRNDMLKFEPVDVKYLLVKSLQDVPKLTAYINSEMADYNADVLDVLKTRVIILDEILHDY
jgi:hypothetical protein